jgi:hypothetical protein
MSISLSAALRRLHTHTLKYMTVTHDQL